MIWTFIIFIVAVSVATIAFPLFWNKLQLYHLPENSTQDYSQADYWLSALSDLEVDNPTIVAFGEDAYKILKRNFNKEYIIHKIPHYSMYIAKEKYRKKVKSALGF